MNCKCWVELQEKAALLLFTLKEYNLSSEGVNYSWRSKRVESWTSVIAALSTDPKFCCTEPWNGCKVRKVLSCAADVVLRNSVPLLICRTRVLGLLTKNHPSIYFQPSKKSNVRISILIKAEPLNLTSFFKNDV